jgi:hypothetical protein
MNISQLELALMGTASKLGETRFQMSLHVFAALLCLLVGIDGSGNLQKLASKGSTILAVKSLPDWA